MAFFKMAVFHRLSHQMVTSPGKQHVASLQRQLCHWKSPMHHIVYLPLVSSHSKQEVEMEDIALNLCLLRNGIMVLNATALHLSKTFANIIWWVEEKGTDSVIQQNSDKGSQLWLTTCLRVFTFKVPYFICKWYFDCLSRWRTREPLPQQMCALPGVLQGICIHMNQRASMQHVFVGRT